MAQIETWFTQDLKKPVKVNYLDGNVFSQDNQGNVIGVEVYNGDTPASLSGSVSASVVRSDGYTVAVVGTRNGNKLSIALPEAAYAIPGVISIVLKLADTDSTVTLLAVVSMVYQSATDAAVDPGDIIPSIADLIEEIQEAINQIPSDYSDLVKEANVRAPAFPNFGYNTVCALTMSYSSDVYTTTVNHDFRSYGIDQFATQYSIGHGMECDCPMPDSFSSSTISGFAVLCFDKTDRTTSSWKIVGISTFKGNLNLCPIAIMYHEKAWVLDDGMKYAFTNCLTSDDFLRYEKLRIASSAFWYSFIHNTIAPITGRINLIPSEHKLTFDNVILSPGAIPGSFTQVLGSYAELDWHSENNPNYARCIYLDNTTGQLVALCSGQSHPTAAESFDYRRSKQGLALICIVYNGNFVYTCGACLPGRWFKNGVDIYAGNSDPVDLYKAFQKVGVIGDSLSVGYMYNKDTGTATSRMLKYSWPKEVMKLAGVPWLNLGTSGQNVLTWCTNSTYGKVQAEASGNKCQAYIIGLGENDQSDTERGVPLGTSSDIVDNYQTVATTYYGGYARIIQILKHLNPDCKIFCLTNPRTGGNRAAYNEAVRYIAGTYYTETDNVFLVDLANNDGGEFNGSSFLPVDSSTIQGGHYSAIGYARIASIIAKEISNTIEANQTYFVNIAFIDYDTGTPTDNTMN